MWPLPAILITLSGISNLLALLVASQALLTSSISEEYAEAKQVT
jgi:hypothetical protein